MQINSVPKKVKFSAALIIMALYCGWILYEPHHPSWWDDVAVGDKIDNYKIDIENDKVNGYSWDGKFNRMGMYNYPRHKWARCERVLVLTVNDKVGIVEKKDWIVYRKEIYYPFVVIWNKFVEILFDIRRIIFGY